MHIKLVVVLSILLAGCNGASNLKPMEAYPAHPISIISMISSPAVFDQKKVTVQGILSFQYDDYSLYLHTEDYQRRSLQNALRIDNKISSKLAEKLKSMSGKFVEIDAVFRASIGSSPEAGVLVDVSRVEFVPMLPRE